MVTMTFDHVGLMLVSYSGAALSNDFSNTMFLVGFIFRVIGRIAFPLYIFMIVEGVKHTKNFWLYFLRISIVGIVIMIAQIIISVSMMDISSFSSPFMDLMVIALMVYLLNRKDKFSWFSVLPIAFLIFTYVIQVVERANMISITWFPGVIRPSYSIFGLILGVGFFYAYRFAYLSLVKKSDRNEISEKDASKIDSYRLMTNTFASITLVMLNLLLFVIGYVIINNRDSLNVWSNGFTDSNIQTYSIIATLFIFFYNGKRGYNKPWFKYFSYAYFPLHIVIIFLIFYVIFR